MGIFGIIIIAIAISFKVKKDIGETTPLAIFASAILMYLFGRYTNLKVSLVAIGIVIGAAFIYCIYKLISMKGAMKYITTWGGMALLFYIVFFGFYSLTRDFCHPDEFYCWGMMAKNYYYSNNMFSSLNTAISGNHPTLLPVWEYFATKTWICFSDSICYFAYSMMTVSLILPIFTRIKYKLNPVRFVLIAMTVPLFAMITGLEAYYIALPDSVIAMLMCYFVITIMGYYEEGNLSYYVSAIVSLMGLILIKRAGVIFAGFAIMIAMPLFKEKFGIKGMFKWAVVSVVTTSLTAFTWFGVSKNDLIPAAIAVMGIVLVWAFRFMEAASERVRNAIIWIMIFGVVVCVGGAAAFISTKSSYVTIVLARFFGEFLKISWSDGYCNMAYGCFVVILVVFILYLRGTLRNEVLWKMGIMVLMSMLGYAVIMLAMHITSVGPLNDYKETLITRYLIPWESLVVFLIYVHFIVNTSRMSVLRLVAGLLSICFISGAGSFYYHIFSRHHSMEYYAFEEAGITLRPDDMIYYIDEKYTFNYADREFFYKSYPARTNFIYDIFEGYLDETDITAQELSERFEEIGYNYFYLQTYLDDFVDRCGELFENPEEIAPGRAYEIVKEGSSYKLRLLKSR